MKKLILICGIMAMAGCAPAPVAPNIIAAQQTNSKPEQVKPIEAEKPVNKTAEKPKPKEPQAPPTKAQIKMCVDYAKEQYQWKDKESVRADSAEWSKDGGGPKGGILILQLNAKNGYGAYGGSNWTSCLIRNNKVISMSYVTKEGKIL